MQFRDEVKAFTLRGAILADGTYLPGSHWNEAQFEQALLNAAMEGCSKVECSSWKAMRGARKLMAEYYAKNLISYEWVFDDMNFKVKSICGNGYGIIVFVVVSWEEATVFDGQSVENLIDLEWKAVE